jgi:Fe-S-cluster-containing dehydrogenase component
MARLGLLIDVTKCSGCHNCFLACRDEYYDNDYSPYSAPQPLDGQFWMQVKRSSGAVTCLPTIPCRACTARCSLHRCGSRQCRYRRADGFVIIDPEGYDRRPSSTPAVMWSSGTRN